MILNIATSIFPEQNTVLFNISSIYRSKIVLLFIFNQLISIVALFATTLQSQSSEKLRKIDVSVVQIYRDKNKKPRLARLPDK